MDLKFVDLSGPVTIPAESAETVIKVATDSTPARPARQIEITQTLDNRQLNINGALTLEVKATATGLVPDLEDLLDLEAVDSVAVRNIYAHEGLQITELNTWADEVAPSSERRWTISLDGDEVRASETPIDFRFPPVKAEGATSVLESYTDMNLVTLTEPTLRISREMTPAEVMQVASKNPYLIPAAIAGAVLLIVLFLVIFLRNRTPRERLLRARDVFSMPEEIDGFAVVALLRRLCKSPLVELKDSQKEELQADLEKIEQACFRSDAATAIPESDLRALASKWLRSAT
jgi:hypothetical protein